MKKRHVVAQRGLVAGALIAVACSGRVDELSSADPTGPSIGSTTPNGGTSNGSGFSLPANTGNTGNTYGVAGGEGVHVGGANGVIGVGIGYAGEVEVGGTGGNVDVGVGGIGGECGESCTPSAVLITDLTVPFAQAVSGIFTVCRNSECAGGTPGPNGTLDVRLGNGAEDISLRIQSGYLDVDWEAPELPSILVDGDRYRVLFQSSPDAAPQLLVDRSVNYTHEHVCGLDCAHEYGDWRSEPIGYAGEGGGGE